LSRPAIHPSAALGFQAGADAYERGRPSFPAEAVAFLIEWLGIGPSTRVLELGAGTGKLTRQLVPSGASIVAVEPVPAMREKLEALVPGVQVLDGTAEDIPVGHGSVDAVAVAQAFHWFDGRRALAEIHRVLRPGGRLGLLWNARDESVDWSAELTRIMDPHRGSAPRYATGDWQLAFEDTSLFGPLHERSVQYVERMVPDQVVDRVLSVSFIAALPDAQCRGVAERVRHLLVSHPDLADRDEIAFPYRTDVFWCERA
jgi:SAM-dependent methyltransferase